MKSVRYFLAIGFLVFAACGDDGNEGTCEDGVQNQDESAVDCGGVCGACPIGDACRGPLDCETGICSNNMCAQPSCSDGLQNGDESDIDCGGSCGACPMGASCGSGGDCLSGGCSAGVCTPGYCGDANRDMLEECDDGVQTGACDADCTLPLCGDMTVNMDAGEVCDDGFPTATCDDDCTVVECGDGLFNPFGGEDCDDAGESATCDDDCTFPECGDGNANMAAGENCDDAGESATCDADCSDVVCGDNYTNTTAGEDCDVGGGDTAQCDMDCTFVVCGDGYTNTTAGEICDDAGESATCDDDCTLPECGDGNPNQQAGEACDTAGDSASCDFDCTFAICGDLYTNNAAGEDCDEGGETPTCDVDCTFAICGDGVFNGSAGEECDDGGESANCDADCTLPVCGDGIQNPYAGEACDDGGTVDGDGCSATCTIETPTPLDISPPGGTIVPTGTIDGTEWVWARPLQGCGSTSPPDHYYDVISIVNNTGADQAITLTATWMGDGYLHVFTDPFNPFDLGGCVIGDDDFNGTGQSQIADLDIVAGQVMHVIASTFSGGAIIGDYDIEIRTPGCGDGFIDPGEDCDDGNTTPGDGCDAMCIYELVCGDGFQVPGVEECDDGNTNDNDGCSSTCMIEYNDEIECNHQDVGNGPEPGPVTNPHLPGFQFRGTIEPPDGMCAPGPDFDYVLLSNVPDGAIIAAELFDVGGAELCANNTLDSELALYEGDGVTQILRNDDSGVGWCSAFSTVVSNAGTADYYIRAASSQVFDPNGTFDYRVVIDVTPP